MAHKNIFIKLTLVSLLLTPFMSCAIHQAYQKDSKRVGEVVPCSARVGKKITELIRRDQSPKMIIEVGAGSGALTNKIIAKMNEFDHLDLVEIEPLLCETLQEKFGHLKNVSIRCMDFLEWHPNYEYDYIVSTLPFNSFPAGLVQKLTDHLIAVAKNGANLGFVEFKWLSSLRMIAMNQQEKEELQKTRNVVNNFYTKYKLYDTDVYMNFPPIVIYHMKIDKGQVAAKARP